MCRIHERLLLAFHHFWRICDGFKLVRLRVLDERLGEQRLRGQILCCVELLGQERAGIRLLLFTCLD